MRPALIVLLLLMPAGVGAKQICETHYQSFRTYGDLWVTKPITLCRTVERAEHADLAELEEELRSCEELVNEHGREEGLRLCGLIVGNQR